MSAPAAVRPSSLRAVLDAVTDAIAIHRDGKVVYVNPAALKLLGYASPEDVFGRPAIDFVAPRYREVVARRMVDGYSGRDIPEIEESFLDVGGHEVPVEVLALPIEFEGRPATLVHVRDLRARKELEKRLRAAERLAHMGFVASAVLHELRGPLAAAMATMEVFHARLGALDPELRDGCLQVRENLFRLRDVVRDVGIFSGAAVDPAVAIDIHVILDSVIKLVGFELRGRARIVKRYGDLPRVEGSQAKLGHVFANLLVNAAQAIAPGHEAANEVTVVTYARPDAVVVEVRDTGVGVLPENEARLFEPFFTTKPTGTGLGLSIARSLVESVGGHIAVQRNSPHGTTFVVSLPRADRRVR